jgi:hypothetical protein
MEGGWDIRVQVLSPIRGKHDDLARASPPGYGFLFFDQFLVVFIQGHGLTVPRLPGQSTYPNLLDSVN